MYRKGIVVLSLFGFSLALSSASCVTCPDGQQSCGNSNPSAEAGASGTDDVECDLLTQLRNCMDNFCKTASNPFCKCYKLGFDLTTNGCKCVDFDAQALCDRAERENIDATTYDCAAASSGVSSYCVGVD